MVCKRKKGQLNNQGFSLVELIVIMIIIVVLATSVVVAFVNTSDQKVKASATLVSKYMDNVLNSSMTKGSAWLRIRYDADKEAYYVEDSDGHSEKLSSGVSVSYDIENGAKNNAINVQSSEQSSEQSSGLMFSFSRVNGSFSPIIDSINSDGTFKYRTQGDSMTNIYVDKIHITSGDSARTIILYVKTGVYEIVEGQQEQGTT